MIIMSSGEKIAILPRITFFRDNRYLVVLASHWKNSNCDRKYKIYLGRRRIHRQIDIEVINGLPAK